MADLGGRFNRFLNMIGLVEEEPMQNTGADYGNDYAPDNYGAMSGHAPTRAPRSSQPTQRSNYGHSSTQAPTRSNAYPPSRSNMRQNPRTQPRAPVNDRGTTTPRRNASAGSANPYAGSAPRTQGYAETAQRNAPRSRTVMLSLQELTDCCDVIDNLIMNNTVVLTMDDMDRDVMQRAIDTLSGAVFALHATFRRASEHTFLIAPAGVEVNDQYDPDSRF